MKIRSKRYKSLKETLKSKKMNTLDSALNEIKKMPNTKFTESVDVSFKINLKKIKGSDNSLRTVVILPNGNGKKIKVAVLCDDTKLADAKKSGADIFGSDDLIKKITSGAIEFDKLICTPNMMPKMGKLGKILGPKGLMPNPKLGTVTNNIESTVKALKSGQIEIKSDKELNALYRSADVFLSPSTGCNAPSTIRESTVNNIPNYILLHTLIFHPILHLL